MADNLIDILKGYITPDVISRVSSNLGESESGVSKAISAAIPTVLGGLANKSGDSSTMTSVMNMINTTPNAGNMLDHISSMLSGSGSGLLDTLFGNKQSEITGKLANSSGISGTSAEGILGMVASLVMGYFAKSGTSMSDLTSLLSSQKDKIMSLIPSGHGLGFGQMGAQAKQATQYVQSPARSGSPKWMLPLLLILAALLAVYFFSRNCEKKEEYKTEGTVDTVTTKTTTTKVTEEVKTSLGNFFKFKLPNGVELNAPEFGIENKLNTWLMDATKTVDEKTWFDFDRLLFDTGKATLQPQSHEQLNNIVEIMKAYPNVNLKIGGYTDNVGDPVANQKLSDERAKSVMNEMVKMGIDASRLQAEGYGDKFPVASNDTEEGRAQNRRISVRVTKK